MPGVFTLGEKWIELSKEMDAMKEKRKEKFEELLALMEKFKHVNQYV